MLLAELTTLLSLQKQNLVFIALCPSLSRGSFMSECSLRDHDRPMMSAGCSHLPTDRRTDRGRVIVRLLLNAHIIHVDNAEDLCQWSKGSFLG